MCHNVPKHSTDGVVLVPSVTFKQKPRKPSVCGAFLWIARNEANGFLKTRNLLISKRFVGFDVAVT